MLVACRLHVGYMSVTCHVCLRFPALWSPFRCLVGRCDQATWHVRALPAEILNPKPEARCHIRALHCCIASVTCALASGRPALCADGPERQSVCAQLRHDAPRPPPVIFLSSGINPNPHNLQSHPAPDALHPTPYTLHPTPYNLHPTPCTMRSSAAPSPTLCLRPLAHLALS